MNKKMKIITIILLLTIIMPDIALASAGRQGNNKSKRHWFRARITEIDSQRIRGKVIDRYKGEHENGFLLSGVFHGEKEEERLWLLVKPVDSPYRWLGAPVSSEETKKYKGEWEADHNIYPWGNPSRPDHPYEIEIVIVTLEVDEAYRDKLASETASGNYTPINGLEPGTKILDTIVIVLHNYYRN